MKRKCSYCGKMLEENKIFHKDNLFCSEECVKKFDGFVKTCNSKTKSFIISVVLSIIIMFVGMLLVALNETLGLVLMNIGVFGTFGTMIVFPFATPESIKLFGIKNSVIIVRVIAISFILFMSIPMINRLLTLL